MNHARRARSLLGLAAVAALGVAALGCDGGRRERATAELVARGGRVVPAASAPRVAAAPMEIAVTKLDADPSVDADGARVVLRDAEGALRSCLEPDGSTGVLALRVAVERDGAAVDVRPLATTTYGGDDARACMVRIVESLRFPAPKGSAELAVTLEIRPRRD